MVLQFLAVDNVDLTRKIVENNLYVKTRENVAVLYFLAVDNFDLTRKIARIIWLEKIVKSQLFALVDVNVHKWK